MMLPEAGMGDYCIESDGDGFEANRMLPDGKTRFVGWFSRECAAQHWIESRVRLTQGGKVHPDLPVGSKAASGLWIKVVRQLLVCG
jgi:hypothetical protein